MATLQKWIWLFKTGITLLAFLWTLRITAVRNIQTLKLWSLRKKAGWFFWHIPHPKDFQEMAWFLYYCLFSFYSMCDRLFLISKVLKHFQKADIPIMEPFSFLSGWTFVPSPSLSLARNGILFSYLGVWLCHPKDRHFGDPSEVGHTHLLNSAEYIWRKTVIYNLQQG